jgi:hypothetical protein
MNRAELMRTFALSILALTLMATAACNTDDDAPWTDTDDDTIVAEPTPEMRAQFTALRSEVDSVVGDLRSSVETRQEAATGDTLEDLTDISERLAERRGDLLQKLDELDRASVDEARSIRTDVASGLADLEADVFEQELRLDREEVSSAALEEHLVDLEQNLDAIESLSLSIRGGVTARPGQQGADRNQDARAMSGAPVQHQVGDAERRDRDNALNARDDRDLQEHVPGMDEIQGLREDLQEARRDAAELGIATGDDRRDGMHDLGERVADLTREVRTHWYNLRYSFADTGMRGDAERQGTDQEARD